MEADFQIYPKVSGYLEKKGRKKMMSCYKKYWFVLEGRLLLYYKSKDEYDAISPCKGSINLGPTCNVKPCTSNVGVFQIESKTTTFTLRAETRDEQHKWMQAIMSALNQNNNSKRLSHFRYSLGELSPTLQKPAPLERQHTFPERFTDSSPKPNTKIIEKLQRIGAQTYGIGPNKLQRSKTTLEHQKQMSFSDESLSSSSYGKKDWTFRKAESAIIENEKTGMTDRKRCADSVESVDASSEGIYERIPSNDSVFIRKEDEVAMQESGSVNNVGYCNIKRNTLNEVHVINNMYTEPGEGINSDVTRNVSSNENDIYWKREKFMNQGRTKHVSENIDYNDNNLKEQRKSTTETEHVYSEADCQVNRSTGNSAEYADIVQYAEISPRNSSLSSQGSSEDKERKKFKGFGKKSSKTPKEKTDEKKTKIKKSESFLQRVWLKKTKNKKNKKDTFLGDDVSERQVEHEDNTVNLLTVLQDILENKKDEITKFQDSEESMRVSVRDQESSMIYHEVLVDDNIMDGKEIDENSPCPMLPPRNRKQRGVLAYHDLPKNIPALPPKKKRNGESIVLDEILNDLNKQTENIVNDLKKQDEDKESQNEQGKVKALIKRFSIGKEEGVELRKKNFVKMNSEVYCTDTGELDTLLEELAKVTTAPIMAPGVTTSLINPEITDTELLKLIPVRRRRISDPDYDIPRPHRSLTNLPKKDDNALEATRFFGPILKPSDFETYKSNRPPTPVEDYFSLLTNITADSLEVDCHKSDASHDENRNISYRSHDYLSFNKRSHHNLDYLVENNIYADPRLFYKSRHEYTGIYPQGTRFDKIEDSENNVYVDSLET